MLPRGAVHVFLTILSTTGENRDDGVQSKRTDVSDEPAASTKRVSLNNDGGRRAI